MEEHHRCDRSVSSVTSIETVCNRITACGMCLPLLYRPEKIQLEIYFLRHTRHGRDRCVALLVPEHFSELPTYAAAAFCDLAQLPVLHGKRNHTL